ncbi:hypothetical protein SNEBB_002580 [Seison nebaliae]|nr:hypothetical protein SNEBB_002580 [Seison nebaliae]
MFSDSDVESDDSHANTNSFNLVARLIDELTSDSDAESDIQILYTNDRNTTNMFRSTVGAMFPSEPIDIDESKLTKEQKNLLMIIKCPICLNFMKNCQILNCGHNLCVDCLKTMTNSGAPLSCPICRVQFTVYSEKPRNFIVQQLSELNWKKLFEVLPSTPSQLPRKCVTINGNLNSNNNNNNGMEEEMEDNRCFFCKKSGENNRCTHCSSYYCMECMKHHSVVITSKLLELNSSLNKETFNTVIKQLRDNWLEWLSDVRTRVASQFNERLMEFCGKMEFLLPGKLATCIYESYEIVEKKSKEVTEYKDARMMFDILEQVNKNNFDFEVLLPKNVKDFVLFSKNKNKFNEELDKIFSKLFNFSECTMGTTSEEISSTDDFQRLTNYRVLKIENSKMLPKLDEFEIRINNQECKLEFDHFVFDPQHLYAICKCCHRLNKFEVVSSSELKLSKSLELTSENIHHVSSKYMLMLEDVRIFNSLLIGIIGEMENIYIYDRNLDLVDCMKLEIHFKNGEPCDIRRTEIKDVNLINGTLLWELSTTNHDFYILSTLCGACCWEVDIHRLIEHEEHVLAQPIINEMNELVVFVNNESCAAYIIKVFKRNSENQIELKTSVKSGNTEGTFDPIELLSLCRNMEFHQFCADGKILLQDNKSRYLTYNIEFDSIQFFNEKTQISISSSCYLVKSNCHFKLQTNLFLQEIYGLCHWFRPCKNGGKCKIFLSCECLPGFTGERCETVLKPVKTTKKPSVKLGNCGQQKIKNRATIGRIVGGNEARAHSWPWQAWIKGQVSSYSYYQCGGSLINKYWIVTAAHCFGAKIPLRRYSVTLGVHDKSKSTEQYRQSFKIDKLIIHDDYNNKKPTSPDKHNHDIALIKLDHPAKMTEGVNTVCLPVNEDVSAGKPVIATGWGRTMGTSRSGDEGKLQQVTIRTKSSDECLLSITKNMICAGEPKTFNQEAKDACQGDSGGPLVRRTSSKNPWHLAGIVSWGTSTCDGNGVYVRVHNYIDWIEKETKLRFS